MADLDGNGTLDIVSGSWPGEIYVFDRKRNGVYQLPGILAVGGKPLNVGKASAVAVADWNGDGTLDLVVGNIEGQVHLIPNTGRKPQWGKPKRLEADGKPIVAVSGDAGPCVADWDGDGLPDLILGAGSGAVQWFRNTGTRIAPKLAKPVDLVRAPDKETTGKAPAGPATRAKPAVVDWNGDGRLDLLVGDFIYNPGSSSETTGNYHGFVWVFLRKPANPTAAR